MASPSRSHRERLAAEVMAAGGFERYVAKVFSEGMRGVQDEARLAFVERYYDHADLFVQERIRWTEGQGPTEYQLAILRDVPRETRRQAIRSPHGTGKTAVAAWIVLWFACTREAAGVDWKALTTADKWRQLIRYLWPEIHKWAGRITGLPFLEEGATLRESMGVLVLTLPHGSAFPVASNKPETIEGAHADELLYVFDEAKIIPESLWVSAEGAFASGVCYAVAVSTPGVPSGRFYAIHARKKGTEDWRPVHITLADAIKAGRINAEWAEKRKAEWGETSAMYQNRVLGEFAQDDSTLVIPLSWVEAAQERWYDIEAASSNGKGWGRLDCVSVDVARFGSNDTAIGRRYGKVIRDIVSYGKLDTMQTTGRVIEALHSDGNAPETYIVVDVVGVGGGVYDRLAEQGFPVAAFNAGERAQDITDPNVDPFARRRFANVRAQAWWHLRELLNPVNNEDIALPPDEDLTKELCSPTYGPNSAGRTIIESKDTIYERLGHSTDRADVVVQAFWQPPGQEVERVVVYDERVEISPY